MAPTVSASCAARPRGVVGQQGCCYGGVSARRGVAVCRDAQRVITVGQRSRLRTTLLPRTSSQVVKPAQAGALTTPPLPESCRAASSARIALRALWSVVSLAESAAFVAYEASSVASALAPWSAVMLASRLASWSATKASVETQQGICYLGVYLQRRVQPVHRGEQGGQRACVRLAVPR